MMDYAAEIERGARAPQAGAEAREGTVVVPGRRVRPSLPAERPSAPPVTPAREEVLGERLEVLDVAESDYSRRPRRFEASRLQAGGPLPRTPISETPEEPVRRPRRPGLERLDRYSTLKRAIVLSEILGRPPGLEGAAPIERQWSKD